jgi:hypothetical protein
MNKSDKKEYVFKRLNEVLLPKGYELFKSGSDPSYVLKSENIAVNFFFNFKDLGQIDFSSLYISIKVVENIMFEVKIPNNNYDFVDNKKYFLNTIYDKDMFIPENYYRGIGYDIETQKDLEFFTDWIINYIETTGKDFIETYSYLPNILKKMDELQAEGKYWNEILAGGPEFLLRGLIISKLCNDKNYGNKLEYVKELYISMADEYLSYYEKLKERLKTVVPIYNL